MKKVQHYILITVCLSLGILNVGVAQEVTCTLQNKALCEETLQSIQTEEWKSVKYTELVSKVGKQFLSTPYVASTLEVNGQDEKLVVNLGELDCTTFLENAVVFSRLIQKQKFTFEDFTKELELLRYRDGALKGYSSRLHYFTEWIANNEEKGIIKDVTQEVGGELYHKTINFMSTHRKSYPSLVNDDFYTSVQEKEVALNAQKRFYIAQENIRQLEKNIQEGDLIAITTKIKGLDISHVGLATWKNNRLHLLHASSVLKKVVVSEKPLAEYIMGNKNQSGIMVARMEKIR